MSNLKSHEFRIGNLLQDQLGNLLKITDLNDGIQGITYRPLDKRKKLPKECIRAEEIPLTEEWAVKLDFENLVEMAEYFISESRYPIEITAEDLKSLKLHEALNLFKYLTGEELK